ncbi:MAG: hypothetical protein AUK31_04145 [Fibrobacteres bacterium CG2_30_45_31]|nr:MAG: hypothetical protein AUK31_04145 [Fibrobacteres bacterium CG2_30_45_31]
MKQKLLFFFFSFFLYNCSLKEDISSISYEEDLIHSEMVLIKADGESTQLGTNSISAPSSDKPAMAVHFSYNFSISKSEVTRGEYALLMGQTNSDSSEFPQTNITFYDAILYANERSIREGYDTAYSYISISYNTDGNCINLEGLVFNPEKEAYRLPTEAEWVLAAKSGWNLSNAWTSENSDYRAHAICTIGKNDFGLCDMAGNVMEWVNDWFVNFSDTSVINFVGGPDGGNLGQRIVKGGSFRNAAENITTSSRSDIYVITSSMKGDALGFRLVFGKITNSNWITKTGVSSSRIVIPVSSRAVKAITNTYRTKLAFVDYETGNLAYIDFFNTALSVTEINDTLPVFHPEISPDGKRVAFCTKIEGISGKSQIYVRDLNAEGSNLVKLDVESAAIPRWRVDGSDTMLLYVSDAGNNKIDVEWKQKSTWKVPFSNDIFGIPEKIYDGSFHGGISEDGSLAVTGARLLRANINGKDVVWYNGEQACNVALAQDSTKRTLFLDFGGETGKAFVGENYGTHERILIADSLGNLIQSILAPDGFAFDHTEWSNISDVIVASITNSQGAHSAIYLLNTKDSSSIKLAEGNELWHPTLWVGKSSTPLSMNINLDSAGIYYTSESSISALELRIKMEKFWKNTDNVTAVALGSSRTMLGLFADSLHSETLLNMGYSAGDSYGMNYLSMNYVLKHISNLKFLLVEISPDILFTQISDYWSPIHDNVPGYVYDENHNFWPDGVSEYFISNVIESPQPLDSKDVEYDPKTFLMPSNSWGRPVVQHDSNNYSMDVPSLQTQLGLLSEIKKAANSQGVTVIGIVYPQNPGYAQTGAFGIYGVRRSVAKQILDTIQTMGIMLFDENKMGFHDYTDEMAYNTDHLSYLGAAKLTSRVDALLQSLKHK